MRLQIKKHVKDSKFLSDTTIYSEIYIRYLSSWLPFSHISMFSTAINQVQGFTATPCDI